MANYETLKTAIQQVVKTNGNNEIKGALLQQSLLAMINSLGAGYQFMGIATPTTNPGTPDQNLYYIASTAGTYSNFGGIVLSDGEVAFLTYNGSWSKNSSGFASKEETQKIAGLSVSVNGKFSESYNTDSGYKFINKGGSFNLIQGLRYTFTINSSVGTTVMYARLYEQGVSTQLVVLPFSASDTQKSYSYIAPRDMVVYLAFGGPESRSVTVLVECEKGALQTQIDSVNINVEEIENKILTPVGNFYQNAWVRYTDGVISSSSGGAKLYIIKPEDIPDGATKIVAKVCTENNIFAAIAFYSGETPSTEGYLKSVSVQGKTGNIAETFEVEIPENWGCCIVLNMSQYVENPTIRCDWIAITSPNDAREISKNEADKAKALFNLFAFKPFYHHLNQEMDATRQSIPAQSLLDISYSRRLGATMIELNAHKCSDNVFVCKHGESGKLGAGLSFVAGSGIDENTLFSAVSSTQLRQFVKYACNRSKFQISIPTLDEFCQKCKQENIAIKIGNDAGVLAIARQYLPDDMIFMTATARSNGFRGTIEYVWYPTAETIAQAIEKCDVIGAPIQITIAAGRIDSMTDAQIKDATNAAHLAGYGIGVVYTNTTKTIHLLSLGIDSVCSTYRQINLFEDGNTINIVDVSDSRIERDSSVEYNSENDTLFVPSGSRIYFGPSEPYDFGKICVSIRYNGNVTINCGTDAQPYNLDSNNSNGEECISWALAISPDSPNKHSHCFQLLANEDTTIYELKAHFSLL